MPGAGLQQRHDTPGQERRRDGQPQPCAGRELLGWAIASEDLLAQLAAWDIRACADSDSDGECFGGSVAVACAVRDDAAVEPGVRQDPRRAGLRLAVRVADVMAADPAGAARSQLAYG